VAYIDVFNLLMAISLGRSWVFLHIPTSAEALLDNHLEKQMAWKNAGEKEQLTAEALYIAVIVVQPNA
jgi:hypothetical protein